MSDSSHRIDEERVCIDSLVQYLKEINQGSATVDRDEPIEPPDYWLTLGGRRYAVEITSIVIDQGYVALCKFLLADIKKEFLDHSVAGTYALKFFRRPDIPKRGSKNWAGLVSTTVASIESMSASPAGTEKGLLKEASGTLSLSKWSDSGSTIGMCCTPEAKWEGEVRAELAVLLREAIEKKRAKIQKKGILAICSDVLLLFYDAYGYGDIESARRAFSTLQGYEWLHSIYWAASFSNRANILFPDSPGRNGKFLYSRDCAWQPDA